MSPECEYKLRAWVQDELFVPSVTEVLREAIAAVEECERLRAVIGYTIEYLEPSEGLLAAQPLLYELRKSLEHTS